MRNNSKGFIQIPILIVIIVGVLAIGGGSYFGVKQYQNYQVKKINKEQEFKKSQDLLIAQQKIAEQEKQDKQNTEMEKLKQEVETLKNKPAQVIVKESQPKEPQNITISAAEIGPYLTGVGEINCYGNNPTSGSGSLWHFGNELEYAVLTNKHVITTNNCDLVIADTAEDIKHSGIYNLGVEINTWNAKTDIAVLKIDSLNLDVSVPILNLNYNISSLPKCSPIMAMGSPVVIVGYPAFAQVKTEYGSQSFMATTNGIISAHDTSVRWGMGNLPYPNYFVSAKVDSGNSGGIAFSKTEDGLCILGVPTWLSLGNYETQGLIQNIHNVLYVK